MRDLIIDRAEGNPFFIEELIKMLIEERVILKEEEVWRVDLSHLAEVHIPSTLVEVLQARFDSLSPEERVFLQRASVLGRVFGMTHSAIWIKPRKIMCKSALG